VVHVDTSVWIDVFRKTKPLRLEEIVANLARISQLDERNVHRAQK
jgi:predicted nucleic acid-binding protein